MVIMVMMVVVDSIDRRKNKKHPVVAESYEQVVQHIQATDKP